MTNETHFRGFVASVDGTFATMAEVIAWKSSHPLVKPVRPVPSYRGVLTIGSPDLFPGDAICIDVERYPRTKRATPLSASKYVPPPAQATQTQPSADAIQGGSVALQRTYKIKKGEEEVEVSKEELDKAYLYGQTIVYMSDADAAVLMLQTTADLGILGFVEQAGVCVWSNEVC